MTEELGLPGQDSDGGSEEVVLTPAELIERLEQAWMNEKFAPDLLESKPEIVECVMEQLDHMEENLRRAKKGDLKISIHRMEIERIRYVLSSYLRCRLMKIEKFFPHVLEKEKTRHEEEPSSLSPEEFAFAKEYMANIETYLKNVALKHMPPNLQKVDLLRSAHINFSLPTSLGKCATRVRLHPMLLSPPCPETMCSACLCPPQGVENFLHA
ncbi:DNA replication complex GINS protein SLD5 isoform X2 [Myotis daubentonii]|uniref:DNA replication complex GINS protein SLD5 isoform X2 n=1 Tax=Myotis daubentonii TaxID=98922 RepID=UPI0028730CCA|nr:DNA replication complex GINS protein SLD5 isoform X2 [Myotis daubentonii]